MGDAITRNAGVTASERHRFLAQVPAPRRRVLHFGKCACKRQLVLSLTSAGLGEQKANQAVRGPAGVPGDLVAALSDERHGDPRKVTGSSQRSPLHAAGSGRCLHSENARATATRTFTDIGGSRRAEGKPSRLRRCQETPAAELGSDPGHAGTGRSRIGFRLRQHCAGELASPAHGVVPAPRRDTTHHLRFPEVYIRDRADRSTSPELDTTTAPISWSARARPGPSAGAAR